MTGFMPITMQTSVATQDTSYLRQNQLGAQARSAKVSLLPDNIPNDSDIQKMVASALELQKQNVCLDRGSILNILA
jgi:hypothetical protein